SLEAQPTCDSPAPRGAGLSFVRVGQTVLVAEVEPPEARAASSRSTRAAWASASSRAFFGLHRPVSSQTNGRKTIWPARQIHHQRCHWIGESCAAFCTVGAFSCR